MRVQGGQRTSRRTPNNRARNKRGAMSDGASAVKIKKRKLQTLIETPADAAILPTPGVSAAPKRKAVRKTSPVKKGATGKLSVAAKRVAAKRTAVKAPINAVKRVLAASVKKAVARVTGKKVSGKKMPEGELSPPGQEEAGKTVVLEEKTATKAGAKKLPGKKVSDLDSSPLEQDEDARAASLEGKVMDGAEVQHKKPLKKVKAIVNKAKVPRASQVKDTSLPITRKKGEQETKKASSKKTPSARRHLATAGNKKTRRKPNTADVSGNESTPEATQLIEQSAIPGTSHQVQVIDGVARNLNKGGGVVKKTKDNESCAIKGKTVVKNKKPLTKKTPKNAEEIIKTEVPIETETADVSNTPVKKGDKELNSSTDSTVKATKTFLKKKVKEVEKEMNTKKIAAKKMSLKAATLLSKAARTPQVASVRARKLQTDNKKPPKKERKSSELSRLGVVDNDDNSSTSDECTLDLLLRRQKQIKREDGRDSHNIVKSEYVEVKPHLTTIADLVKSQSSAPNAPLTNCRSKAKVKVETNNKEIPKTTALAKKKVTKKAFVSKLKATSRNIKKKKPSLVKKLKLAARKTVASKVKRMRPNEVTKLGGGSGSDTEQRARRIKLFGFWSGPKRHRVASLNALAKVHCLYENESRSALLSVCTKPPSSNGSAEEDMAVEVDVVKSTRKLRSGPGRQGVGMHWDQHTSSSTSSSEDSVHSDDSSAKTLTVPPSYKQKQDKGLIPIKVTKPVKRVKKPRKREVVMDLKDMVVRKRMASLNASAILAASYSVEKPKKPQVAKEDDSPRLPVNDPEKPAARKKKIKKKFLSKQMVDDDDSDDEGVPSVIELTTPNNKQVATVILNQDTDVTITGVFVNSTTHRSSTTHEGYCSIAGMQYRISSTSHTQTEATAVATETLLHAAPELVPAPEPPTQPLKSYTPLGALSNMQPPGGPLSPLGRRHGCTSAFTAPPPPPLPPPPHLHPPTQEPPPPPYMHGYYQPAGPLISAHHHHGLPKPSVLPPLEASPTPTPPTLTAASSSGTRGGDESSDNDVVITATSCSNQAFGSPPSQTQPTPPSYRYPQNYPLPPTPQHVHHQYPYTQYPQQYYPPGVQGVQYAGAPPQHYHQDLCYSAPSYPPAPPYYHHKTYSTPPPVSYPRRYGPPHPSQYYPPPDLYPQSPDQQTPGRQMVPTASTSGYQPAVEAYPPPPSMVDPYPPPPPPPTGYYTGYPPAPCYQHSPPTRSLAFIDTAYQGCPCPMQSCPKNVHTGPLTGDGKGPDASSAAATFHQLPLPPVALALPLEPPNAMGPPSPARGSAGMHPPPSPLASAQGSNSKQEPYPPHQSDTVQDLSSKNVGLLTIHKPPTLTVLQTVTKVKTVKSSGHINDHVQVLNCDIEPKHHPVKLIRLDSKEQNPVDFSKVDPKVEKNVKLEVGSMDGETKAPVLTTVRKRKMKTENVSSPKPKKRNTTAVKKVCQFAPDADIGDDKVETPAQRKSKNQPLLSANSCSLHNSKQNVKKRKLSDAKDLAENQEPAPVVTKEKSVEEKVTKEPKSRPKLCPVRTQTTKAKCLKTAEIAGLTHSDKPEGSSSSECISNSVNIKTTEKDTAKTTPIANTISGTLNRKKTTKAQLNKIQHIPNGIHENPSETVKINAILNRKKVPAKSQITKLRMTSAEELPVSVGKVQRRRQTDSDAMKVNHMLRSHGIQDPRPVEHERMTNNSKAAAFSSQALVTTSKSKVSAVKKTVVKNGFAPNVELVLSQQLVIKKGGYQKPKWSNGWTWEGDSFQAKVHLNSEETAVDRRCYPAMRHSEGDLIRPRDCILLKSGPRKMDLPFVAKVAQLWENPDDGEMMVSLLWYYRPEHTEFGRRPEDMSDEIFASKHKDTNSVACIEDKCYVLTFNEYCRYRASARRTEDSVRERCAVVPQHDGYPRSSRQPTGQIAPDMVFFCRRVYDFRQKRILKNPG